MLAQSPLIHVALFVGRARIKEELLLKALLPGTLGTWHPRVVVCHLTHPYRPLQPPTRVHLHHEGMRRVLGNGGEPIREGRTVVCGHVVLEYDEVRIRPEQLFEAKSIGERCGASHSKIGH